MAAVDKPTDGLETPLGSTDALRTVWSQFRIGVAVVCPRDEAPLALAVDGATAVYRFVCTECGAGSAWFESSPVGGLRIRGDSQPDPTGA